jgi:predicted small secreted protein
MLILFDLQNINNKKKINKMSLKKIIALICVGIVVLIGIITTSMYFSYNNDEVSLRKEAIAQKGKIEGVYDKMWKILQQKAQVTDQYKDAFSQIYPKLISGRYSQGDGSLMKWIKESNPNFDTSLYKDLMASIEAQREDFQQSQERMLDIIREHETLCNTYPSKWFVKNDSAIQYTVVSSTISKQVINTGKDDNIDLFK